MEYIKSNYKAIAVHIAFWVAFILYTAIDDGHHHHDHWSFNLRDQDYSDIAIAMFVVYVNLYILMPFFYAKEKYLRYLIALLSLLIVGGFMNRFMSWAVWLPRERLADPTSDEPTDLWEWIRIFTNALSYFPVLAISVLIKLMLDANAREKKLREMEKEKFTAEMGLLKAQINPHFFFNTLNSLYSLSLARSKKSAPMVLRLSDLMRYMLYEASANTVLLKDEIIYIENYIGIEQMRYADRLDLSFQYSGDIAGKLISPLLLLPFVENAFKHGIEDSSGWITIDLKVAEDVLYMKVENSFSVPARAKKPGLGLANAKKRLALAYPGKHELHTTQNEGIYSVDLTLQL
jgi:hypothetical protein